MEQIEETTTKPQVIQGFRVVYSNSYCVRFGDKTETITINKDISFLDYLVYGYIKDMVEKDPSKNTTDSKKRKDIIEEALKYFGIKSIANELDCFKNVCLLSLKTVYIDMVTEDNFDILALFPGNINFYLKFRIRRGCVKHLSKNIKIDIIDRNSAWYHDFSYISRANLYSPRMFETAKDPYISSLDKRIKVHASKVCLSFAMTGLQYNGFDHTEGKYKPLKNPLTLMFTAKLRVLKDPESEQLDGM